MLSLFPLICCAEWYNAVELTVQKPWNVLHGECKVPRFD